MQTGVFRGISHLSSEGTTLRGMGQHVFAQQQYQGCVTVLLCTGNIHIYY